MEGPLAVPPSPKLQASIVPHTSRTEIDAVIGTARSATDGTETLWMTGGAESKPAAAGGPPGPSCQTATPLPSPSTARKGTVAVGLRTWVVAEAPLGRGITRTCPFGEAQPTMASCAGPTA